MTLSPIQICDACGQPLQKPPALAIEIDGKGYKIVKRTAIPKRYIDDNASDDVFYCRPIPVVIVEPLKG